MVAFCGEGPLQLQSRELSTLQLRRTNAPIEHSYRRTRGTTVVRIASIELSTSVRARRPSLVSAAGGPFCGAIFEQTPATLHLRHYIPRMGWHSRGALIQKRQGECGGRSRSQHIKTYDAASSIAIARNAALGPRNTPATLNNARLHEDAAKIGRARRHQHV